MTFHLILYETMTVSYSRMKQNMIEYDKCPIGPWGGVEALRSLSARGNADAKSQIEASGFRVQGSPGLHGTSLQSQPRMCLAQESQKLQLSNPT